jgi:peptidoglycan/LPS O-acetylase OafA/YrhL
MSPRHPLFLAKNEIAARFGEVPCLNGLRAVSILIVLLSHFVDAGFFPGGFGVYVFFVISGFLITRLLFAELKKNQQVSISRFYARRFLRLYPVISIYTIIVLAAYLAFSPARINIIEPLSALFYFANYLYSHYSVIGQTEGQMPFLVFWSLSVEEHFYFLFPVVFMLTAKRPRRLAVILTFVIVGCLFLRALIAYLHPELLGTYHFYYRSEYRLDSLAFGVLISVACETTFGRRLLLELARPAPLILALLVLLFCFVFRDLWFRETIRYFLQGISLAVALTAVLFTGRYKTANILLNLPVMAWIGKLSYSLYVWHTCAPDITAILLPGSSHWEQIVCNFLLTFAIASASYYIIERPFMNFRHRFGSHATV